jgi:mono/diheme cytochrome c family protein
MVRKSLTLSAWALAAAGLFALPAVVHAEEIADYTGAQLFKRFCASCHGQQGEGNGPVASSFKTMVPDLTRLARRRGGLFPKDLVRHVIDGSEVKMPHGSRDMPVWGQEFWIAQGADEKARQQTAVLIDRLVDYLATIQR